MVEVWGWRVEAGRWAPRGNSPQGPEACARQQAEPQAQGWSPAEHDGCVARAWPPSETPGSSAKRSPSSQGCQALSLPLGGPEVLRSPKHLPRSALQRTSKAGHPPCTSALPHPSNAEPRPLLPQLTPAQPCQAEADRWQGLGA